MDQLLAKITNLGYEVFGIFVPGLIFGIFILFWWIGLGNLVPHLTSDFLPEMSLAKATDAIEKIGARSAIGAAVIHLVSTYFLGHILQRLSRVGSADEAQLRNGIRRTAQAIRLNILKPQKSFDHKLSPLYEKIKTKLDPEGINLDWPQFYPIAKNYVARNSNSSLISTYQNKYTLHRSITMASVMLFWGCIIGLMIGAIGIHCSPEITLRWGVLSTLIAGSLVTTWAFSDSFAYNWILFGNSVITESYSILYGSTQDGKS